MRELPSSHNPPRSRSGKPLQHESPPESGAPILPKAESLKHCEAIQRSMADTCIGKSMGNCQGPVVADLVLQAKRGNKNVGKAQKLPLCVIHAAKGGAYTWMAHTGEAVVWGLVKSIAPGTPRGLHLKYRVVVREPWRKVLRDLGYP